MNRIEKAFCRPAFVGYLVGGHGGIAHCAECCLALIRGGVDILEIGLPFSDPTAEGPVISRALAETLRKGVGSDGVCEVVRQVRERSEVPIVVMGYYNPLFSRPDLYQKLALAGADGLLIVDLPPDEAASHCARAEASGLETIFLAVPGMSSTRLQSVAARCKGFLYYVCRKGTTGVRADPPPDLASNLEEVRKYSSLPRVVGFGIGSRPSAQEALRHAEGFVVGSAFVDCLLKGGSPAALEQLARTIDPRGDQP
jgi:tryptophan synthase alpha chain